MTDQTKQKLKYWLIGLFSGGAVAAPITAFICKNVYEKKIEETENKALNDMAAYALNQQNQQSSGPLKEEDYAEKDQDIHNYDLSIDDDDAVESEEARERTEAHERYLDMIDRYKNDTEIQPRIISADDFNNEQYMEKCFVNWYEQDNVFEENLSVIEDPYATFGVVDGHDLFKNADLRFDPDICYVRNERTTTDFEISRIHGSYAHMVGGEAGLGETDT